MKLLGRTCWLLLAFASCRERPSEVTRAPSSTETVEEIKGAARTVAEKVKVAAQEVAAEARVAAGKAGDQVKEMAAKASEEAKQGARELGDRAEPTVDRLGEGLKSAGDKLENAAADQRAAAAREVRAKVDDVERWFADEARPAAKKTGRKLWVEIRGLARDLGHKLDRVEDQAGPAAARSRREIKEGLDKLRARLRRVGEEGP